MAHKLKDLTVTEVSLVDKPANPGAKVVLFKRAETTEPAAEASLKDRLFSMVKGLFGGTHVPEDVAKQEAKDFDETLAARQAEERIDRMMSDLWEFHWALKDSISSIIRDDATADKKAAVAESIAQFQQKVSELMDKLAAESVQRAEDALGAERLQHLRTMRDELDRLITKAMGGSNDSGSNVKKGSGAMDIKEILKGLPDEQRQQVEAELAKVSTLEQQVAELTKGQPKPEPEDIWKGINPEIRKQFEDMKKRAEEAERMAKAEREAREHAEMVKRAEAYSHVGKAEDVAKMLEQAYAVSKEYGEQLEATLKAAQERIEKGALFAEVGKDGQESSALAKIEAKAAEIRKAEPTLTREQAFTKALEADPQLYVAYQQELQ